MKIRITDIHRTDAHYDNRFEMINKICELVYTEINDDVPGYFHGGVTGDLGTHFYAFKYEEYNDPMEIAKDPIRAHRFLHSAGIIEADGEPSSNYYEEEAIDDWRKSRIRELLGRIKFASNEDLIKFLNELKSENIND